MSEFSENLCNKLLYKNRFPFQICIDGWCTKRNRNGSYPWKRLNRIIRTLLQTLSLLSIFSTNNVKNITNILIHFWLNSIFLLLIESMCILFQYLVSLSCIFVAYQTVLLVHKYINVNIQNQNEKNRCFIFIFIFNFN